MNSSSRTLWIVVALVMVVGIGFYVVASQKAAPATTAGTAAGIRAIFACDVGKTIDATFLEGSSTPAVGDQPPVPGGSVHLILSDSRDLTLPQTLSADGARYANADESLVFWNVGNTATIDENGTTTFANCVTPATQ